MEEVVQQSSRLSKRTNDKYVYSYEYLEGRYDLMVLGAVPDEWLREDWRIWFLNSWRNPMIELSLDEKGLEYRWFLAQEFCIKTMRVHYKRNQLMKEDVLDIILLFIDYIKHHEDEERYPIPVLMTGWIKRYHWVETLRAYSTVGFDLPDVEQFTTREIRGLAAVSSYKSVEQVIHAKVDDTMKKYILGALIRRNDLPIHRVPLQECYDEEDKQ